ncbi:RagB/SusD family nutrient uptake outer membrane protein [uncultured Duncaniella sp.]|uniref:RagB/SusD family nutrient uptake outer membrane protein n=2 Tax=Bacteria TaxID=2 RepID=UPI002676D728|nr:RagB/SusD family nutrient uptake outer membrane protein [uncultured Duncaniella sp.]
MKNIYFSLMLALGASCTFTSCEDVFEPQKENLKDLDQMYDDATYAQGFLLNVYRNVPHCYGETEYATDDAVCNVIGNDFRTFAQGGWTPTHWRVSNSWSTWLHSVLNINLFLENVEQVKWANDPEAAELFKIRTIAEARGLRALFMYNLLREYGGVASDGSLLGVPLLDRFYDVKDDFNLPRASFADCVKFILEDLDHAEANLPLEYNDLSSGSTIPAPFNAVTSSVQTYNRVFGESARQLYNGLIARAIRSRITLLAASPAFEASGRTWDAAADAAGNVLDYIGGIAGMASNGVTFYCNTSDLDALGDGSNPKEIIWRENLDNKESGSTSMEEKHFPPSLYGKGECNPTQNLVDAFPMANGYPISDSRSNYNAASPYAGRDPRLSHYIIYNGSQAGVSNTVINTGSDASTADGLNKRETSTRTGYYMKKRLRMDVNCNPSGKQGKRHYNPRIRYTEIFLNYAEAANEAWGPKGVGSHGYSAYDVIKAIRHRALGIDDDPYLDECASDVAKMRELIRNERRLELCFENFRFWDLRRWKADLTETARGVDITNNSTYTPLNDVEAREFSAHMIYGPIPEGEVLKFSNLLQNQGW